MNPKNVSLLQAIWVPNWNNYNGSNWHSALGMLFTVGNYELLDFNLLGHTLAIQLKISTQCLLIAWYLTEIVRESQTSAPWVTRDQVFCGGWCSEWPDTASCQWKRISKRYMLCRNAITPPLGLRPCVHYAIYVCKDVCKGAYETTNNS